MCIKNIEVTIEFTEHYYGSIPCDCRPFHFPLFSPQKHLISLYIPMWGKSFKNLDWENHRMGSLFMERIIQSTPNGVLTAHTEWLSGVRLRHFSTTYAVYIEDCEGWWLSGCRSSVAEHWQTSWVRFPAAARLFTFLYRMVGNFRGYKFSWNRPKFGFQKFSWF